MNHVIAYVRQDRVVAVVEMNHEYADPADYFKGRYDRTYIIPYQGWQEALRADGYDIEYVASGFDGWGGSYHRYRLEARSIGADGLPL